MKTLYAVLFLALGGWGINVSCNRVDTVGVVVGALIVGVGLILLSPAKVRA
jgi:hypothetical protein